MNSQRTQVTEVMDSPERVSQHAHGSVEETERLCVRNLLDAPEERVFFKDLESRFLLASTGWLTHDGGGRSLADVVGRTDAEIFGEDRASESLADERFVIRSGEPVVGKIERRSFDDRPDGWVSTTTLPLRGAGGEIVGVFGICRDVSAQIEAQRQLAHQALHDPVTGLLNRAALMDRVQLALAGLERQRARVALLFVDLDDFKSLNDSFGHAAGDSVLAEIGGRLQQAMRRTDAVARFGGDVFVICLTLNSTDDLRLICDRIVKALREPVSETGVVVTGSVGAVETSDSTADPNELLQRADLAMYAAKRAGRNGFEVYARETHGPIAAKRGLAADLRHAVEQGELFLVYQPLYHLGDGSISSVEALVRWRHPERGLQAPSEFIPVAEKYGMIELIDSFVLDEACRQLAVWTRADPMWEMMSVAVNLSGRQLRDSTLVDRVSGALERHEIAPSRLCLEITETALIGELDDATGVVESLAALGVRIALDDFGTGYSTLAHLQRLRADVLKIDRSFVSHLGRNSRDHEIIAAVTAMAHALGMTVVGEGVETHIQRSHLGAVACDEAQGYLFSPPLSAESVAELVLSARTAPAPALIAEDPPRAA
jgi:diguanylate cyclase (GGDEF)-like protein/PAS domain S-box-containing protein